eukprot:jgi/Tetstr1/447979/TSEL_035283.t1
MPSPTPNVQGTTELKELEGGLEHAKAALKDAKATRKAKADKARMLEVDVKTATKKLKVQAKRVEDCLAAGFHRHPYWRHYKGCAW